MLSFIFLRLQSLSLGVSSSSCLFEVFFTPVLVPPQPVCLALFCVTVTVPIVLLTRLDLRFPPRRGFHLGRVRVAVASVLSVFRVTSCGGIHFV